MPADFRRREVDERRVAGDGDRFVERPDLHDQVERGRLPDAQHDAPAVEGLEAIELPGDPVPAGNHL